MKLTGAALRRFLDSPDPAIGAILFYGPNRTLAGEATDRLLARALKGNDDPFALTKIAEDELKRDKARLDEALRAQSLLGGARVVRVRVDGDSCADVLLAATAALDRGENLALLLVDGGDLGGSSKLVKGFEAARRAAVAAFYDESDADRAAFARAHIAASALSLAPGVEEALLARLPEDRGLARNELDKLALFAYQREDPVSLQEAMALLAAEAEAALDEATLAALSGQFGPAIEALDRLDGVSGISALKALQRRLLRLLEARGHIDRGLSASEAGDRLRPKVFWSEKEAFAAQLRMWSTRKLLVGLNILWQAEIAAKSAGSPQDLIAADAFRRVAGVVGAQAGD